MKFLKHTISDFVFIPMNSGQPETAIRFDLRNASLGIRKFHCLKNHCMGVPDLSPLVGCKYLHLSQSAAGRVGMG